MKRKLLKYKGIPISPIVLFKTILNNENKTLDKVLFELENELTKLIQNGLSQLTNSINTCMHHQDLMVKRLDTLDSNYYKLNSEVNNSLKLYDIAYIDGVFTYDTNSLKVYDFSRIHSVRFDSISPIDINNRDALRIEPIQNMSDFELVTIDPMEASSPPYIKQKSTGDIIITFSNNAIYGPAEKIEGYHVFYLYSTTTYSKPDYKIKIYF